MRIATTGLVGGALLIGALSVGGGGRAYAQVAEDTLGDIYATDEPACPSNAMLAVGQTLPIVGYQALFAVLATTYGGDGVTNFRLPDLREEMQREGVRYCVVIYGVFPNLFGP